MLTESFISSIQSIDKPLLGGIPKDSGVFIHELKPHSTIRSTFKKSVTKPHCLVVTSNHVFAAQADKAVIVVFNRAKGNQECLVPFPERITSLAWLGDDSGVGALVVGTENGRLLLWETCTGRLVSMPPAHLQSTALIAVDVSANFIITGSADSNVHVWNAIGLLSFTHEPSEGFSGSSAASPMHSLSAHRGAITALTMGHSRSIADIAITGSADKSCIVWDYRRGVQLHTFLFQSPPTCLTLDPADRALYVGYEDGGVHFVDFLKRGNLRNLLYDPDTTHTPTQPGDEDRWSPTADLNSVTHSLALSYDGMTLLSGHQNGKVLAWNVGRRRFDRVIIELSGPVTNLQALQPTGFSNTVPQTNYVANVVRPRHEASGVKPSSGSTSIPNEYTFSAVFNKIPPFEDDRMTKALDFDRILSAPTIPEFMIDDALAVFESSTAGAGMSEEAEEKIVLLQKQLEYSRKVQDAYSREVLMLKRELAIIAQIEKDKDEAEQRLREADLRRYESKRERMAKKGYDPSASDEDDDQIVLDEPSSDTG